MSSQKSLGRLLIFLTPCSIGGPGGSPWLLMCLIQQPAVPSRALRTLGLDTGKIKVSLSYISTDRHLKEFSAGDALLCCPRSTPVYLFLTNIAPLVSCLSTVISMLSLFCSTGSHSRASKWHTRKPKFWGLKHTITWASRPSLPAQQRYLFTCKCFVTMAII